MYHQHPWTHTDAETSTTKAWNQEGSGFRGLLPIPSHSDGKVQRASCPGRVNTRQPCPRTAQLQLRQPQRFNRWPVTVSTEASFKADAVHLPPGRDAVHELPVANCRQDGKSCIHRWSCRVAQVLRRSGFVRRAAPAVCRRHMRPKTECRMSGSRPHSTPSPSAAAMAHPALGTHPLLCLAPGLQLRAAGWSALVLPRAAALPGKQRSAAPQLTPCLLPPAAAAPGPLHVTTHVEMNPATLCCVWSAAPAGSPRAALAHYRLDGLRSAESQAAICI